MSQLGFDRLSVCSVVIPGENCVERALCCMTSSEVAKLAQNFSWKD